MKAVHLTGYGDPLLCLANATEPEPAPPGAGEVLVAVEFAPINVNDLMIVWEIYPFHPTPPIAIGNEGSGIVLALGEGVEDIAVGDRVVLPFMARTWRQRIVVRADRIVPLPADADPHQAAMLSINAVTAVMLLDDYVTLQPGDAVLYNAATSGLARWLAVLAKARGLQAIGMVRRPEDVAAVKADNPEIEVVSDDEPVEAVRQRLAGYTIRLGLDGVAGRSAGRLVQLLSPGATLVTYGAASREPMAVPSGDLIFRKIAVRGFWEGHPENAERVPTVLRKVVGMIGPGGVRQPIAGVYTLDRLDEAVAAAVRREKVLLDFRDAPDIA